MEIEPDPDDKKEYSCPSNKSHIVFGRTELQKHIMRCKDVQGKKFYQCKYDWTHMYHGTEERDTHEEKCPQKREGVQRYKDFLFVPKDKEMLATEDEKNRNKEESRSYFYRNQGKLQEEKELRRRLREKREYEAAENFKKQEAIKKARQELERYYSQDYVLQNAFYLVTETGSFFMVVAQPGTRKLEKKNLEMKMNIDLGEKFMQISQLEYSKILAGEFVPHFDYEEKFTKLKKQIDSSGSIACKDYCESNDELVVITSHKYVPYIPENRLALLVLCNSKFEANERPFNIPENNTSNIFVNEYNQLFSLIEEKDQLEKNFENENAIATFEYRESIKRKLRQVISLLEESKITQTDINQRKNDESTLNALVEEEKKLKQHEEDLSRKEKKMETELGEYKKKLTQDFLKKVNARQEQLNQDINHHYNTKFQVFHAGDQEVEQFTEKESELRDQYAKTSIQIEINSKTRKKYEARVQILQGQINEKKKMLSISKNIALTSVLDYLCHICQKNSIDILFYPCNHFFVCQECQKKASEVGRHECLYCNENVEKVLHVLV